MATKIVNDVGGLKGSGGGYHLKESSDVIDIEKVSIDSQYHKYGHHQEDDEEDEKDQVELNSKGWESISALRMSTLHKNDMKSGQLIDEISDLRDVLRRSVIGPLSREIIDISEQFTSTIDVNEDTKIPTLIIDDDDDDDGEGGGIGMMGDGNRPDQVGMMVHSKSINSIHTPRSTSSIIQQHQQTKEDRLFYDSIANELDQLTNNNNNNNLNNNIINNNNHNNINNDHLQHGHNQLQSNQLSTNHNQKDNNQVTITKDRLINLMKEYKKTKDDLKDQTSIVQEMDNQLSEVKEDLELKKKKIQLLKSTPATSAVSSSLSSNGSSKTPIQPVQQRRQSHQPRGSNGGGSGSNGQSPSLGKKDSQLNTSINNLLQQTTATTGVLADDLNIKIEEALNTAKYRIERTQFKNRVLLTSSLHNLSTEIHTILERRITKRQVNAELRQNAKIVADCDGIKTTVTSFMTELQGQLQAVDTHLSMEEAHKKKNMFKTKEKSRRVLELERTRRQIESAISFLKIEKRSVRELRDRFVSVCNDVTKLYEACNTIERDLSKWDIELERIYLKVKEGYFSDYFKLHPVFQSCSSRIKDHSFVKQDLTRELARREAARIASEIYVSGIAQILECGTDLITDERMVDVARVRGLEHQVHMLYHALHDQQTIKSFNYMYNNNQQPINQQINQQPINQVNQQQPRSQSPQQINQINQINQQQQPRSQSPLQHQPQPQPQSPQQSQPIPKSNTSNHSSSTSSSPLSHSPNHRPSSPTILTPQQSPIQSQKSLNNNNINNNGNVVNNSNNNQSSPILQKPATPILSRPKPLPNPHVYQQQQPHQIKNEKDYIIKQEQASPLIKPESIKPDSPSLNKNNNGLNNSRNVNSININNSPQSIPLPSPITIQQQPVNNNNNIVNHQGPAGSLVMEIMIKNYDILFPTNNKPTSPILIKTAGHLDALQDLTAEVLIHSAQIASGDSNTERYTDSLKVNGNMMGADQVDVYMTSELLKHFFQSVDPFLTKSLFQDWLLAERIEDQESRIQSIKQLISKLTDENRAIIGALVRTLNKVIDKTVSVNPSNNPIPAISRSFSSLILRIPN